MGLLLLGPVTLKMGATGYRFARFIVWLVFTGMHVLGHLPLVGRSLRVMAAHDPPGSDLPGAGGRWIALAGAVVAGLVIAIALIPQFHPWTPAGGLGHHHEH